MSYRFGTHAVYTQSWQGLKSDTAVYESLAACQRRKAFAAGGQETWCCGFESFEQNGYTFLGIGPDKPLSKRGSQGVNITLSHRATEAWKRAGCEKHVDLGPRLMAVRLEVRCGQRGRRYNRKMGIFLISLDQLVRSYLRSLESTTMRTKLCQHPSCCPSADELARLSSVLSQPTSSNYSAITYNFLT